MRVLVVSHLYPNDAQPIIGSFVADQVDALRAAGIEVTVVNPCPWVPPLAKYANPKWRNMAELFRAPRKVNGVEVAPAAYAAAPRNHLFWLGGPTLARSLERNPTLQKAVLSFDIVHAHVVLPDGFAAVKWARRHGLPAVCTAHGNDINIDPHFDRLTLAQARWTIRSADAMIAVSRALQQRMLRLETPSRSEVIPSGVNLDAFPPMTRSVARASLGLPADRPIALFVGSLLPVKGVQWLMGAFARVRKEVPCSLLVLVGEGPLLEELREAAVALDIADAVEFAGPQPRSHVPIWMAAANLLVLPSQNEGMPLVILEAMASGLPVVASDVGGIGEALNAPAAGLLAPAGDETALSAAMVRVLTNEDLQRQLGEKGKARASLFSWEINSEKTISLYTEILRDPKKRPHKQHLNLGVV